MPTHESPRKLSFGAFALDMTAYELRRGGTPVPLERRPMDLLILLAERQGELVSRAEIAERLWGPDVFIDIETGVNTAIRKVRRALRDPANSPAFIETVSCKGYRFIAPVKTVRRRDAVPASCPPEGRIMLAVLPFKNLSGDPNQEYFSDGLTEETISYLGRVNPERWGVIARTTSMAYKSTSRSIREIGAELGVDYVLENSVRREGKRVRITCGLIRVRDQAQVWAGSYNREVSGVLDIQRELGMAIASRVRLRLSPERVKAVSRQQTGNAEAYDLYLRGRYFWNQLSPPTTKRAIEFYTRAAQSDPGYALPWSGLADAYSTGPISGDAPPLTVWPLAQEAAARAVETASDLAETQTSLGFLKFWLDWDWSAAEAAFRQAIALNPSYALAHRMLGITLSHMGRRGESLQAAQTARELDPLNVSHHALSSQIAFAARDYATAAQFARRAIAIAPGFWIGYFQLGQVLEQMGETEAALQALASAARLSEGNSKAIALRGYILARSGRTNEAEKIVRDLEAVSEAASGNRYVPPYAFALVHAGLGNRARSLKWLECACDGHDVHLTFLTVDPKWDFLRSDRRFVAILNRCGFGKAAMGEKQVL